MKNTEDIMPDERAECCLFYNGRGSEGITASLKLPKLRENDLLSIKPALCDQLGYEAHLQDT